MSGPPSAPLPAGRDPDLPPAAHRRMASVLRLGLAVALALLAGALVALLVRSAGSDSGSWVHANALLGYLDPRSLAGGLAAGAPTAYLTLGVYALVATPVVRAVRNRVDGPSLNEALAHTGMLQLAFCMLLAAGLLLSR